MTNEMKWLPIESAPKNSTLWLGYKNSLGNWRSTRGQYFSEEEIASDWEDDEMPEGWYETPAEGEECFHINPTHWMRLPNPPEA